MTKVPLNKGPKSNRQKTILTGERNPLMLSNFGFSSKSV